jgi:hypothetical protein
MDLPLRILVKQGVQWLSDRSSASRKTGRSGVLRACVPLPWSLPFPWIRPPLFPCSHDVRRTQRRRPAAGHTLVGLVLEASTQAAGVPGTAATWVAPTGTAPGVAVAPAVGAWAPRARGAREGRVRVFWGARRAAWPIVKAPPPQKKVTAWGNSK